MLDGAFLYAVEYWAAAAECSDVLRGFFLTSEIHSIIIPDFKVQALPNLEVMAKYYFDFGLGGLSWVNDDLGNS